MIAESFNNIGIGSVAIAATLDAAKQDLPIVKLLLVLPLVMHKQATSYLSNGNSNVVGFTSMLYQHPEYFTNFAIRYEAALPTSINSIVMLCKLGVAQLKNNQLEYLKPMNNINLMGKRAQKIIKASANIALILESPAEELYSNLRVIL